MTPEKKKEDDFYSVHEKRHEYHKRILHAHKRHTFKAYDAAVEEHLLDEKGLPDFDKLDNSKMQKKFSKTMSDYYQKLVEKVMPDASEEDKKLFMQSKYGVTPQQLQGIVEENGSDLDYDFLPRLTNYLQQEVDKHLRPMVTEHINDEYLPSITKKLGLEGKLRSDLTLEEGRKLLDAWIDNEKTLTDKILRKILKSKFKA